MEIVNSTIDYIDTIFSLYNDGTVYQRQVVTKYWRGFERSLVEKEISKKAVENYDKRPGTDRPVF